jgi:hypothetical protein
MEIANAAASISLAGFLVFSGVRKLTHQPRVVQSYIRAGVPEEKLNLLALILFAASAGLIAGLFWVPIGIASAIAIIIYFLGAVVLHVRANDVEHMLTPFLVAVFAAVVLILQIAFA